jgi:hypothetical protein
MFGLRPVFQKDLAENLFVLLPSDALSVSRSISLLIKMSRVICGGGLTSFSFLMILIDGIGYLDSGA